MDKDITLVHDKNIFAYAWRERGAGSVSVNITQQILWDLATQMTRELIM